MDDAIQTYQKSLEARSSNHTGGLTPTLADWLFVKAYVVISLILLGFLVWKFFGIFS